MSDEVVVTAEEPKKAKKEKKVYEGPACSVCGKPLSDPESIKAGIGPLCRAMGWTKEDIAKKMETLKRGEVPEGWVKLADVADLCRKEGIPVSRLVRAVGGDRGMQEPVHEKFMVAYVGRARYLDPWVVSEEGLNLLRDKYLGQTPPEPKPRAKKEKAEKPAVKKKAVETAQPTTQDDPWS